MLFYLSSTLTIVLNAFLLFGVCSHIKLFLSLGLVSSVFLFLYFWIRHGQSNSEIVFFAFAYWLLISFVSNSSKLIITEPLLLHDLIINLIGAGLVVLFTLAVYLRSPHSSSPLSILLPGSSILAAVLYFNNYSLSYFMPLYLVSLLIVYAISVCIHRPEVPKRGFIVPIIIIYIFTYGLFAYNEWASSNGFYSLSWVQNYNLLSISSALISSFLLPAFEGLADQPMSISGPEAINSTVSAMWKGRGNTLVPCRRPTLTPSGWSQIITKLSPSCLSEQNLTALPRIDSIESTIQHEKRALISNKETSPLSYNHNIAPRPSGGALNSAILDSRPHTVTNPVQPYNQIQCRHFASSAKPPAPSLDYLLKAEFSTIQDDNLAEKIAELTAKDIHYVIFDQKSIPPLAGIIGTHPSATVIISGLDKDFLLVLTTSEQTPLQASTYNSAYKAEYMTDSPAWVQTLDVSEKLLWRSKSITKLFEEKTALSSTRQRMATTIFIVDKELSAELRALGTIHDSQGTEKLRILFNELKPQIQTLVERSRTKEDPSQIKVVILSKK
jgi:hypothetical protein